MDRSSWARGRPARTRPGTIKEIPVKADLVRFAGGGRGWQVVCRNKVRARRPRSQDAIIHTIDQEHGLHPAQISGKEPCAGLKNHSPLEGELAMNQAP